MKNRKVRILLGDDSHTDADLAFISLKKLGIKEEEIYWVENGEAVLNYLMEGEDLESRTAALQLVILDLKMPRVSGKMVLRELRKYYPVYSLPVIIWSSSALKEDIEDCYDLGANSYLIKPIQFREFQEKMELIVKYWLGINKTPSFGARP